MTGIATPMLKNVGRITHARCQKRRDTNSMKTFSAKLKIEERNTKKEEEKGKGEMHLWLLDRDGVINEDVGSPGVVDVDRFKFIPLVKEALWKVRRRGKAKLVIVTNQTCVGKELISEAYLTDVIHKRMTEELSCSGGDGEDDFVFDAILYETTIASVENFRRKPEPGMVLEALTRFLPDEPENYATIFVGDSMTDMMAAGRAELKSGRLITKVLVGTGYGSSVWNELRQAFGGGGEDKDGDGSFCHSYYYAQKIQEEDGDCEKSSGGDTFDARKESSKTLDAFPEECFPLYVAKDLPAVVDIFL